MYGSGLKNNRKKKLTLGKMYGSDLCDPYNWIICGVNKLTVGVNKLTVSNN